MTPATTVRRSAPATPAKTRGAGILAPVRSYWNESRGLALSIVTIAPLAVLYETGLWISGGGQVNGAEAILRRLFNVLGAEYGALLWRCALGTAVVVAAWMVMQKGRFPVRTALFIAGEGILLGAILGPVAVAAQKQILTFLSVPAIPAAAGGIRDFILQIALSIGAGVYEEIVFRLLILSGIYLICLKAGSRDSGHIPAMCIAVLGSALVFSGFHYWPHGDAFEWKTFIYRSIAGCVLGLIFILRGFGVTVYAHAAYDVMLTIS